MSSTPTTPHRLNGLRSPWRFLTSLDGDNPDDRRLLTATRSAELRIVYDMVAGSRVSLLYSASGNGKTSLVNAGLIPALTQRGYTVFRTRPRPPWSLADPAKAFKTCVLRDAILPLFGTSDVERIKVARDRLSSSSQPDDHALDGVLARLETTMRRIQVTDANRNDVNDHLRDHLDLPIREFLLRLRQFLDADTRMLFVCDQFEELFVHYANTPELRRFASQLGAVWADASLNAHLLFSMREDWVGSMIALRSEIPDIFVNYYRLNPLQRSQGLTALEMPLVEHEISYESALSQRVLEDLVASYRTAQRAASGEVAVMQSPADDPFIEPPALQIVAEQLWQTRMDTPMPFTVKHYESLVTPPADQNGPTKRADEAATSSPSQWVLDHYVATLLDNLPSPDGLSRTDWKHLRLDCLYLLTDNVGHRRSIDERTLLAEVNRLRRGAVDVPSVGHPMLHDALRPLIDAGVVRAFASSSDTTQYELAHDFAVRSIVADWHQLDRDRIATLAIRRYRDRRVKVERDVLARARRVTLIVERALPALAVIVTITALALAAFEVNLPELFTDAGIVVGTIGVLTAALATRERDVTSVAFGTACIAVAGGCLVPAWTRWQPVLLFTFAVIALPLAIRGITELTHRLKLAPRFTRVMRIVAAEVVDTYELLALPFAAMLAFTSSGIWPSASEIDVLELSLAVSFVLWVAGNTVLMKRTGATAGGLFVGLRSRPKRGEMTLARAGLRQILEGGQIVFNIFLLIPSLVISPIAMLTRGTSTTFYDQRAGLEVVDRPSSASSPRVRFLPWVTAVPIMMLIAILVLTATVRSAQSVDEARTRMSAALVTFRDLQEQYERRTGHFAPSLDSLGLAEYRALPGLVWIEWYKPLQVSGPGWSTIVHVNGTQEYCAMEEVISDSTFRGGWPTCSENFNESAAIQRRTIP